MKKLAYIIRVATVAPVMALVMLLILYLGSPAFFGDLATFILMLFFLVVLPLLAYPLQPLIKPHRNKGREGQRTLAIIFAVAGYILGLMSALVFQAPRDVLTIYLSYFLSGLSVMLVNKLLHFKASGHACGITGPFTLLHYFGQPVGFFIGLPLLVISWLASLYMKRHTTLQFIAGALIPFAALGIVVFINAFI